MTFFDLKIKIIQAKNPRKMARKTSALEDAEKTGEAEEDEVTKEFTTTSTRKPTTRSAGRKNTSSILDEMLASFEEKKTKSEAPTGVDSEDLEDLDEGELASSEIDEDAPATTVNPKRARRKLERLAIKTTQVVKPSGKAPPKRPTGKAPKRPKRPVPPQFGKRSRTTKKPTTTTSTTAAPTTSTVITTTTTTRRPTTTITTTMRPTTRQMFRTTRPYGFRTRMPMNGDGQGQMGPRGQMMGRPGLMRRPGQMVGRYGGRGDADASMGPNMGRLNYRNRRPVDQYYDNYYSQYDYNGNFMYDTYYDYASETDAYEKPNGKLSKEELKAIKKAEKERLKLEAEESSRLEEADRLQAIEDAEFGAEDFLRTDSSKYEELAKKIEDIEVDPLIIQYRKKESAPLAAGGRLFGYKSLTDSIPEIKTDVSPFYLKSDFKIGVPLIGQNNRLMDQSEVTSCWKCIANSYSDCLIEGEEEICGQSGPSACYVREYTQSDGIEKVYMGCQPIHQCVKDFKQNKGLVSGLTVKGHQQSDQCRPGAPGSVCHQCCSTADECNASWITNILIKND